MVLRSFSYWVRLCSAALTAILEARAVFPMEGRAARMMRSDRWNPPVYWSIFRNPDEVPEVLFPFFILLMISMDWATKKSNSSGFEEPA